MKLLIIIWIGITIISCKQNSKELPNTSMPNSIYVYEHEIQILCTPGEIIDYKVLKRSYYKIIINKDSAFVQRVLNEVTNDQWIKMLTTKQLARSVSLWLHMKTEKNAMFISLLNSEEWYNSCWKREVNFWLKYLNNEIEDISKYKFDIF